MLNNMLLCQDLHQYLSCENVGFIDRIKFASDILTYRVINKGKQRCRYKIVQCNNKGSLDIFTDISDHVTLLQL